MRTNKRELFLMENRNIILFILKEKSNKMAYLSLISKKFMHEFSYKCDNTGLFNCITDVLTN